MTTPPAAPGTVLFGDFRLDRRGLFRRNTHGEFLAVAVGSRALEVLTVLINRGGELVLRDELMAAVWPKSVVEYSNLPVQIAALRRVLDDGETDGSCIQTVSGRGYRFVARVIRRPDDRPSTGGNLSGFPLGPRPRLSIVVLPFADLSEKRNQEYFADGITEDLTTDLSRIAGSFVISCNTAFAYKGRRISAKQVAAELGVRYVLEGSIRRLGNQVRVTAQLIDAETDAHLWAERFDGEADDLFALQNGITSQIAVALDLELIDAEAARSSQHSDATDYIFRGRALYRRPQEPDNYQAMVDLFGCALALDPQSVDAQAWLAITLTARVLDQMTDTKDADIDRAEGLARQALTAAPRSHLAHLAKGQMLRVQKRYKEAIPEYEQAIAFNRVMALGPLGECKLLTGSVDELIPLHEEAIRLSPRDPFVAIWYCRIGIIHLLQSCNRKAIDWLERARNANAELPYVHAYLASAYALNDDLDRALDELTEARRLSRDDRYSSITRLQATAYYGVPKIRSLYETTYFAGLRRAGVPEG